MAGSNVPIGDVCHVERLLEDGALSVILNGKRMVLEIAGERQIPAFAVDRILALDIPLRCRLIGRVGPDRSRAELYYLAWHDKSGDVWLPLAELPGAPAKAGEGADGT